MKRASSGDYAGNNLVTGSVHGDSDPSRRGGRPKPAGSRLTRPMARASTGYSVWVPRGRLRCIVGSIERVDRSKPWRARYRGIDGGWHSKSFRIKGDAYYSWHMPSNMGNRPLYLAGMDLGHPLSSLVTTLSGRVLEVLVNTSYPLSGRNVMRLLRREASQQGVQNALDELAAHGLVVQVAAGGSILNTLNREHILAPHIIGIVNLRSELIDRLATIVSQEAAEARRAILFGSLARGNADEHSDIDIALVWPDEEMQQKTEGNLASRVREVTGNACNLLHYTAEELDTLAASAPEMYAAVESEGIDLIGAPFR